jgi:GNAT superfamily N-acetyltransferase
MIRRARAEDAEAIARVHVRTWQVAYAHVFPGEALANLSVERRVRIWDEYLRRADVGVFVSESDGTVNGFASVGASREIGEEGELFAIYVDPDAWSIGAGRRLIQAGEEWLRTRGYERAMLWVLDDNPRARRFYDAAGWQPDGTERTAEHLGVTTKEVRYRKQV